MTQVGTASILADLAHALESGQDAEARLRCALDQIAGVLSSSATATRTASRTSSCCSVVASLLGAHLASLRLLGEERRVTQELREASVRRTHFLGRLSHELRNPLGPIGNALHVLARVAPGTEQAQRARAIVSRQLDHLTRLVDDIARSNDPGRDTEIAVTLPLLPQQVAPAPDRAPTAVTKRARSVLVIDDDVDSAKALRDFLAVSGHTVEIAYDGAEGLRRAAALSPEVVLCDVGLPGMSGYDVAKALRATPGPRALLVALTGYGSDEVLQRALAAGFDARVVKPVSPEQLQQLDCSAERRRAGRRRTVPLARPTEPAWPACGPSSGRSSCIARACSRRSRSPR